MCECVREGDLQKKENNVALTCRQLQPLLSLPLRCSLRAWAQLGVALLVAHPALADARERECVCVCVRKKRSYTRKGNRWRGKRRKKN